MDDESELLVTEEDLDIDASDNELDEDQQIDEGNAERKKKIKQSKGYTTAKKLNDKEYRMLKVKLEFFDKEYKLEQHKINIEQANLKRELRNINPNIQDDPEKGFFVPSGMTREEAEKLRDHKRNKAPKSTRSISLEEFDEMRKKRSEAVRQTIEELQLAHTIVEEAENGDINKRRKSRAIPPPKIHAVSFTTMAKVVGSTLNAAKTKEKKHRKNKMGDVVALVSNANKPNEDNLSKPNEDNVSKQKEAKISKPKDDKTSQQHSKRMSIATMAGKLK